MLGSVWNPAPTDMAASVHCGLGTFQRQVIERGIARRVMTDVDCASAHLPGMRMGMWDDCGVLSGAYRIPLPDCPPIRFRTT